MSDITERLRSPMVMSMFSSVTDLEVTREEQRSEAADEIDRLRAELAEARRLLDEARNQEPEVFVCHKPGTGYQTVVRSKTMERLYRNEGYTVVGYYAAPVPAQPAVPDDVAKDAARFVWLYEHGGACWETEPYSRWGHVFVVRIPVAHDDRGRTPVDFRVAIDEAMLSSGKGEKP